MYVCGVFVYFLFIVFACELVWNVSAPPDLFLIYNVYIHACMSIGDLIHDEISETCGN